MSSKIAIITGGSRGLGKSMALHLAKKGVDVVVTYNSKKEEAEAVVREIESSGRKAAALQLDVGNAKSFEKFAADFKTTLQTKWDRSTFDFLVNNAGIGYKATLLETTEEQFDLVMNVHFKGVFFLTQKLVPMMEDGGKIINISSGLARFTQPGASVYGSIKAGIEHLTRYWATELGSRRITVNVIAPGPIETDFGGGIVRDTPALNKHLASLTALGRVGVADDIGGAVAALLSEDNRWVNGQRIEVSGGMLI